MKLKIVIALFALIVSSAIILAISKNSKPTIIQIDPAFSKYISGYTSGMMSKTGTIKIELKDELKVNPFEVNAPGEYLLPDSNLLNKSLVFSPAIKGRIRFTSIRTIEFIPAEPLKEQTLYTATFKLSKLIDVEKKYKNFQFQFSTYAQNLFVEIGASKTYDAFNIEWQAIKGTLTLSDKEDTAKIFKTISATQNGKKLKVRLEELNTNIYGFYVDSVKRTDTKGKVEITWNGKPIQAIQKGIQIVEIPALGDFRITKAEVKDDQNQYISLTFSDPIKSDQDLKGNITLSNHEALTYSVSGNEVMVFLSKRIEGSYELKVYKGIKNFKGYSMNNTFKTSLQFEASKPLVRIQGKGNILPNSQGLFMPFESIGLKAVDIRVIKIYETNIKQFLQVNDLDGSDELMRVGKVIAERKITLPNINSINLNQWTKHVIDLKTLITPDPGSIYRVSIKFRKSYTDYDCPETQASNDNEIAEVEEEHSNNSKDWTEEDWHGYSYDNGYDTWQYHNDEYSPCDNNYYDGKAVSRNILASDLGMIYKLDQDKVAHVYVSNMITTEPIANAEIECIDYSKQIISKGFSNDKGVFTMLLKQKPFLIIAKKVNQRGFLKLKDGLANSLSKFDIEGEQTSKGVKGFIYAERGVWRPGDSIYTSFILEDKQHQIPENHPVKFQLNDPYGATVFETTSTRSIGGTYDFRCASSANAKTGNYTAQVKLGNHTFSKRINIETVKPNRLKINMVFPDSLLSEKTKSKPILLQSKWLHGGLAKSLKVNVTAHIHQTETKFTQYKNFIFQSPIRSTSAEEIPIFNGILNESGTTEFSSIPSVSKNVGGMVKATYITKIFEPGGDFSIDRSQVMYSPFNKYIGLQLPDNAKEGNALETNRNHLFKIVSVDGKGHSIQHNRLQLRVYKLKWQWWYEHDEDDISNFVTKNATDIIKDSIIESTAANLSFSLNMNHNHWGKYLITITDLDGGHQTGASVYFDQAYANHTNEIKNEHATMLNFSSDKSSYKKGEIIKLNIPSTAKGKALISIETGTKVLQSEWINTQQGETKYEVKASALMTPNVYIHVTYIQPHLNTMNDLPIRLYGVIPIEVIDEDTYLFPMIDAPLAARPEENMLIRVKEKLGRKMTYTLAMVDEGLLDLTHFKTPQPRQAFFAKQALGVKTWDMYDQVIGAYAGKLDAMISIGGDGEYEEEYSNKANRFVPVVKYLGPFTLEKGQTASHKILIPNYIGNVRVMVVAQHEGSYGNVERNIEVKKPLMLLATLPRVISPNEEITMPVNIFAMESHIKEVQVMVESNDHVAFENCKQKIYFSNKGDEILNFKLKVKNKVGIAKVKIKAICGKEISTQEIEVEVRVPNPIIAQTNEFILEPNTTSLQSMQFTGIMGTNSAVLELSSIPSMGLDTRMEYLIQYPHGCIEQTTSSVFPQLYVGNLVEMNDTQQNQITYNIKQAIRRIQLFQTIEGGFSYWIGEHIVNDFGTNYAGHFLLEAERNGYVIPTSLKSNWLKYQKDKARKWNEQSPAFAQAHDEETFQFLQAYRLYTLALNNTAELGAMNQLREEKNLQPLAAWRLAAAYKLIGQYEVASQLVKKLPLEVKAYKELSYGYGSNVRDQAMILETLTLLKDVRADVQAQKIITCLNSRNWMSTQETAYCLLSLCKFYGIEKQVGKVNATYRMNGSVQKQINSSKQIAKASFLEKDYLKQNKIVLRNNGNAKLYAKLIVKGAPLISDTIKRTKGISISVIYKNNRDEIMHPKQIMQGTDFKAVVTITNTSDKRNLKEMVLSQMFPSGWEIHNSRMDETDTKSAARFLDIRDDRVYTYYDLPVNASKTFTVQLNATYLGKFYLPAINSEAMYDQSIQASLPGYWVEVVSEGPKIAKK